MIVLSDLCHFHHLTGEILFQGKAEFHLIIFWMCAIIAFFYIELKKGGAEGDFYKMIDDLHNLF